MRFIRHSSNVCSGIFLPTQTIRRTDAETTQNRRQIPTQRRKPTHIQRISKAPRDELFNHKISLTYDLLQMLSGKMHVYMVLKNNKTCPNSSSLII